MKRLLIATGGGDCPGLNAVIRAIVHRASQEKGPPLFVVSIIVPPWKCIPETALLSRALETALGGAIQLKA